MIQLTRLNSERFALNTDLIERIEETPDTVVTLIDGTKYVVAEPVEDVIELVIRFRARVVAAVAPARSAATLQLVPDDAADSGGAPTEER